MTEHLVRLDDTSLVALVFVVVISLPHGAFDGAIARRGVCTHAGWFDQIHHGLSWPCGGGGSILVWQPGVALALFLLISALHFGSGDATPLVGLLGLCKSLRMVVWRFLALAYFICNR